MNITFFVEIGFKIENLEAKYYKDYISRCKIKGIKYITLWNLKKYSRIVVKLKAIEYKEKFFYYLFFYNILFFKS